MNSFESHLQATLDSLKAQNLQRQLRLVDSPQGAELMIDGSPAISFASNDYLGLANHPMVKQAAIEAIHAFGAGSGASRLISGTLTPHTKLEQTIAQFKQTEAALAFSSGSATALGTLPALATKDDVIILDKLAHACLIDGARISGATLRVYPHNDLNRLESHLRWARKTHPQGRPIIVTEGIFSMDGDQCPLPEIIQLKLEHDALLLLDEAHAVGVLGPNGRGLTATLGLEPHIDIMMGTLGKAVGSAGGYIAGSRRLIDYLINRNRTFVFSTAPPPSQAAAATAGLNIIQSAEGEKLRAALNQNITALHSAFNLQAKPKSPIIPIHIGGEADAVRTAQTLLAAGFYVPAIRYPTVAKGTARLRLTLSAHHTTKHIQALAEAWGSSQSM